MSKIIAVRLREYEPRQNHKMRSYTSVSGKKFVAGWRGNPSPWRVDVTKKDVNELAEFPQFEIRTFDSLEELEAMTQSEMEERARKGQPAVRAKIDGTRPGRTPATASKREFGKVVHSAADLEPTTPPANPATQPPADPEKQPPTQPPAEPKKRRTGRKAGKGKAAGKEKTKKQLLAEAETLGVKVGKRANKATIAAAIQAHKSK